MTVRLAIVVSHPIPYFAACYRALHTLAAVDLRVFFCCDWGIAAYRDPQFGVDVAWDVPLLDGYPFELLPIARRPRRLGFWEVDNPGVGEALSRFDPHVVMVHGYASRTIWRAVKWAGTHGRPVLLYSDSNAGDRPWVGKRAVKRLVVGRFYSKVDGAMWVSDRNRAYHRLYGLPEDRLFTGIIPVEVDRRLYKVGDRSRARGRIRAQWGIPADACVVILCGKYVAHKRPLDLLRAIDSLQSKGLPVWALLVGDGPERPALEAHLNRVHTQAVLAGFVNQSEVTSYYCAADIVASVSWREPLGLSVAEGVAFGLPVVASDQVGCVGPSGCARPGDNAIVFPAADVDALAAAIERLYTDRTAYARMSQVSAALAETQTPAAGAAKLASAAVQLRALGPRHRGSPIT